MGGDVGVDICVVGTAVGSGVTRVMVGGAVFSWVRWSVVGRLV